MAVVDGSRGPDIRAPPPFVYAAGFVVAWALNQRGEFLIDARGARPPQEIAGAVILLAGLALGAWGFITFLKARAPIIPLRPAPRVVSHGPYRFTRNPMYVGMTFAYLGLAVLINWAWPVVLLPVVLIVMNVAIIEREERHLRTLFPDAYRDYCARVRRWL